MYLRALSYLPAHRPERVIARLGLPPGYAGSTRALGREMLRALFFHGIGCEEFLLFELAGKSEEEKASFLGEFNRAGIYRLANRRRDLALFHDKWAVYRRFSDFYGREAILLRGRSDLPAFAAFLTRHGRAFIKPVTGSCGRGALLLSREEGDADALFARLLPSLPMICEEVILQHGATARFNPTSLNTLRLQTVCTAEGVRVFYPFLRMGRYGRVTDNGAAGGVIVPVDAESGALAAIGRDEAGRYYTEHPDSGVPFAGAVLPRWEECLRLGERLARRIPTTRSVGWDLALSEEGWVMVEANARGQFIGQQLCDRRGKRRELLALCGKSLATKEDP